jgi:serine/threonine protein kinase
MTVGPADLLGMPLGDFRAVREVGRGGMGVVYEAEQISLRRRVALKVLPLTAALDPRQLQRFQNEAQAAAHLHHPHIVPVYAVGCERGVHYFAMQFVEGQPLSALIASLRRREEDERRRTEERTAEGACSPEPDGPAADTAAFALRDSTWRALSSSGICHSSFFRAVARLGVQAAEALEHAHQQGVVHRDVKPANLLLDGHGHLWVTDFGLARLPNEVGLTRTGDLVGTLRYMSPEQVVARRGLVDQRADVYALGATLYELLTLTPACPGRDREEILHQLTREEPRPPRRLNQAVPPDLQTVVLQALEKRPEDRYATAQELADDLKRFLEDRPIRARPPTLFQRVARWLRRHSALAGAAAAVLLVAVVALGVSTALLRVKHEEVVAERNQKEQQRLAAEQNAEQATRNAEQARQQQRRAQQNLWEILHALDGYLTVLDELYADPTRRGEAVGRLEAVLRSLRAAAEDNEGEPTAWYHAARAYRRVGAIHRKLGRPAEAEQALRRAVGLLEQVRRTYESDPGFREEVRRIAPRDRRMVWTRVPAGLAADGTKPVPTRSTFVDVTGPFEFTNELAACQHELGQALRSLGRPEEAVTAHRRALDLLAPPPSLDTSRTVDYLRQASEYRLELGLALSAAGRPDEANAEFGQYPLPWQELTARVPTAVRSAGAFAGQYRALGRNQEAAGRLVEAARAYREALAVYQQFLAGAPPAVRASWAGNYEEARQDLARVSALLVPPILIP